MSIENQLQVALRAWFSGDSNLFYGVHNYQNDKDCFFTRVVVRGKLITI